MHFCKSLEALISALKCLPGVGPKTAERMSFHLLERERAGALYLADAIKEALATVKHCEQCRMLTDEALCHFCLDKKRDQNILCIVENPADVLVLEQSGCYRGIYFVLGGHLSPLDGIGPDEIGISEFLHFLTSHALHEIIIATNSTVEGEATAYYIAEQIKDKNITLTRIAQGVPRGGELAFVDGGTLTEALSRRVPFEAA